MASPAGRRRHGTSPSGAVDTIFICLLLTAEFSECPVRGLMAASLPRRAALTDCKSKTFVLHRVWGPTLPVNGVSRADPRAESAGEGITPSGHDSDTSMGCGSTVFSPMLAAMACKRHLEGSVIHLTLGLLLRLPTRRLVGCVDPWQLGMGLGPPGCFM